LLSHILAVKVSRQQACDRDLKYRRPRLAKMGLAETKSRDSITAKQLYFIFALATQLAFLQTTCYICFVLSLHSGIF